MVLPSRSRALTRIALGRSTDSLNPGTDKQPSSKPSRVSSMISTFGLTNTRGVDRSLERSITMTCSWTSICDAASPIPLASYMVSNMSSISVCILSSTTSTLAARVRRRGSGNSRIFLMAIVVAQAWVWMKKVSIAPWEACQARTVGTHG